MTSCRQLEVQIQELSPEKWRLSLTEEAFGRLLSHGSPVVHKTFGDGSLFSPFLFGRFFDPSDAFPLWEFESDVLLFNLRSSCQVAVDWFRANQEYVLKAELPGAMCNIHICVENGKVLEISGQYKLQLGETRTKDWKTGHWWLHGYVRRIELPENADYMRIDADLKEDIFLEIRIPSTGSADIPSGSG